MTPLLTYPEQTLLLLLLRPLSSHSQLDRLLPPLMSCLLHIDFERTPDGGETKSNGNSNSDSDSGDSLPLPFTVKAGLVGNKWTHWKVRDYAAELLRAICDK